MKTATIAADSPSAAIAGPAVSGSTFSRFETSSASGSCSTLNGKPPPPDVQ
jgi:hypothetical protein